VVRASGLPVPCLQRDREEVRPPCEIEDSGWFEWGMNANCHAQVPHILIVVILVTVLGLTAAWVYWSLKRG